MLASSNSLLDPTFFNRNEGKSNVLSCFEGVLEYRTIGCLLDNVLKDLENNGLAKPIQKKAFRIMMESLENIQKHSGNSSNEHAYSRFCLIRNQSELIFLSSNSILNCNKEKIKENIEEINQSDIEKLKLMQETRLINGELSVKGGSGIGLINIAIRSKNKLEYKFEPIDNETSQFILQVKIKI